MLDELIKRKDTIDLNPFTKNYFIIGAPKVGKSTLATTFGKNPLIISTEKGYDYLVGVNLLEIPSFGKDGLNKRWSFLKDVLDEITNNAEKYEIYDTIVFDTIDSIAHWAEISLLKTLNIKHESEEKWGKAYNIKSRGFIEFIEKIKEIKGKGLMFISHAESNQIEMDERQLMQIKSRCPKKLAEQIEGLCDFVFILFGNTEGKRFIRTRGSEFITAGSRLSKDKLPDFINVDNGYEKLWQTLKGEGL